MLVEHVMHLRSVVSPLVLALAFTGCASQKTLDSQAESLGQQLSELRKSQAALSAAHQDLAARLSRLEGDNAVQASLLDQVGPSGAALQREIEALRAQAASHESGISALSGRLESESSKLAQAGTDLQREIDALRTQAADHQSRLSTLSGTLEAQGVALAQAREAADDAIKIARDSRLVSGKIVDTLTLTQDMVLYNYEQPELTAKGREAMDNLISSVKPLMPHAFIEIIGFSDDFSLNSQNRHIALERAESVRRYLHETGGIPLHRMSTISYGDLNPVASNTSIEGRIQNRRVVIQVLK
jgi:peptidoglycan-associated lipoprotein